MRAHVLLRRVEHALWIAGALATGFCAGVFLEAHLYQALQNRRLEEQLRARRPLPPVMPPHVRRPIGSLVGRLEIPRLGFKAIVLEGSDSGTLRVAVGRIPETADLGQKGNVVLAGHRDTFFRPLKGIRDGDRIEVVTPSGKFDYQVEWTEIINPTETEVLKPTREPSLTLVTCYPFHYVGAAPQRFIVRARQMDTTSAATMVKPASYHPSVLQRPQVAAPRTQAKPRGSKVARYGRLNNQQSSRWR